MNFLRHKIFQGWTLACLALATGSLGFLGCGAAPSSYQVDVVGGSPLDSAHPAFTSVVALVKPGKLGYEAFCSGVLISPDLVATAAHCVSGTNTLISPSILFDRVPGTETQVIEGSIESKPLMNSPGRYYPNFDVAWIRLETKAPAGYLPIEILRDPAQLSPLVKGFDDVLLAGYGKTSSRCDKDSKGCTGAALEVRSKLRRYINTAHFRQLLIIGPKQGFGSCNGDSGGPLYAQVNGTWYLIGLLHGKSALLNSSRVLHADSMCESGEAVYTFLGAYADWIEGSSGTALPRNRLQNPSVIFSKGPQSLPSNPSLADYIRYDITNHEIWFTVEMLLSGFKDPEKRIEPAFDRLVTDPERAARAMQTWERFSADGLGSSRHTAGVRPHDQQISDLRPLAALTHLKHLDLIGQRIRETRPLGELTRLEELTLSNNFDIKTNSKIPWDLRFLKKLHRLRVLNLVTNGESLDLRNVPWEYLSGLESLILSNNAGILDLNLIPWQQLSQLKQLVIVNSELTDIQPLAAAKSLEQLNLRSNSIRDITALGKLPGLRILDVSQNHIKNFLPVQHLERLESLYALDNPSQEAVCPLGARCIYNPAGFLSFAAYCAFAQGLKEEDRMLWSGTATVLRALQETSSPKLAQADCDKAGKELEARPLLNLSGLRSGTSLTDLNPLRPLGKLVHINLDYNQIADLSPLADLNQLQTINLTGNRIRSIRGITALNNLKTLKLDSNLIEDIDQFSALRETTVSLLRNPLRSAADCPIVGGRCIFENQSLDGPAL